MSQFMEQVTANQSYTKQQLNVASVQPVDAAQEVLLLALGAEYVAETESFLLNEWQHLDFSVLANINKLLMRVPGA